MTEAELLAQALDEMRKATIGGDEWLLKWRAGKYTLLQLKATHHYKAHVLLEQAAKLPAPPPPSGLSLQRTIFWANVDDNSVQHACRLGNTWRHALTADPAYTPTVAQVNALKAASGGVDVWHNQTEVSYAAAVAFGFKWRLDRIIQQAENEREAATVTASYCIGNFTIQALGAQWDRLKNLVDQGKLACTHEAYDGNPADDDTQGLPVSSFTLGVAMDAGVRYPLGELLAKTPAGMRGSVCVWHGAGLLPGEWDLLRSLG